MHSRNPCCLKKANVLRLFSSFTLGERKCKMHTCAFFLNKKILIVPMRFNIFSPFSHVHNHLGTVDALTLEQNDNFKTLKSHSSSINPLKAIQILLSMEKCTNIYSIYETNEPGKSYFAIKIKKYKNSTLTLAISMFCRHKI